MKKAKYLTEKRILQTAIITIVLILAVEILAYYSLLYTIPNFIENYGLYIIYLSAAVVATMITLWHLSNYRDMVTHMTGMMIGMTTGMISAFSIGAILGATNGMFVGSVVGVLLGMGIGAYAGKCCGVMGVMEGMMAGLMAGTMGPMISVMMLNDNLQFFMPLLIGSSLVIMGGLTYMMHKDEMLQKLPNKYASSDYMSFVTICFVLTLAITFIMAYGPRSFLFAS